jgi:secreted trypsin-like serine protease
MNARDKAFNDKIGNAITQARKAAGDDDAAFLEHLRTRVAAAEALTPGRKPIGLSAPARALSLSVGTVAGPRKRKGPLLASDPRYLANIRELVKQKPKERILGGSDVEAKEFDDCVAVGDDERFGCTGTLIAPNAVLTAAHCEALHTRVFIGNNLSKKGRTVRVKVHHRHAKFDSKFRNDVMILILEENAPADVKPRALASTALIDAAKTARVVGFGTTDVNATQGFGAKRQTDVPIVSQACRGMVGAKQDATVYGCHRDREIVAGKPLFLHDTCKGDSGGPFFVIDAKGQWLLAGVTSRGTDLAQTMCGDGGVYVRVDAYAEWIASILKQA